MVQVAFQMSGNMWDKRAYNNLTAIIINYICYDIYIYELLLGTWNKAIVKALFYTITSFVLLYFTIEDYKGWNTIPQLHSSTVYKLSIVLTFLFFSFILRGKIE